MMMGAALKKVLPISRRIQLNRVHSTGACGGAAGLVPACGMSPMAPSRLDTT